MNCTRNRDAMLDLARHLGEPDDATGGARERVRMHLATCGACRRRFEEQQALTEGLRALGRDTDEAGAQVDFEAMERRLLSQFEQERGRNGAAKRGPGAAVEVRGEADAGRGTEGANREAPGTAQLAEARAARCGHSRRKIPIATESPWLRLAALLVLAAGALVVWRAYGPGGSDGDPSSEAVSARSDGSPESTGATVPEAARPADAAGRTTETGAPTVRDVPSAEPSGTPSRRSAAPGLAEARRAASAAPTAGPARTAQAAPRARAPRHVEAVGFVPVPIAASLPPFERGEIVRMEMGMRLLSAYGVDISPDPGDQPIQVDLLVAQDGLPRAIRLVTSELLDSRSRQQ